MVTLDKEKTYFEESFDKEVCPGDEIQTEIGMLRITAKIEADNAMGPPWEEHCGHGEVTVWTRRDKLPGELVVAEDRGSRRYYDFAGAVKIARRDGWGVPNSDGMTKGQIAAAAAREDFEHLRRWCADLWSWVGIVLSVEVVWDDEDGDENTATLLDHAASVWGVDTESGSYLTDLAEELIPEALDAAQTEANRKATTLFRALSDPASPIAHRLTAERLAEIL